MGARDQYEVRFGKVTKILHAAKGNLPNAIEGLSS